MQESGEVWGSVVQLVEPLPGIHKALGSIPNTTKNKTWLKKHRKKRKVRKRRGKQKRC
jgi:hypothetical protein